MENSKVLSGALFSALGESQQLALAQQAHTLLRRHPDTMLASQPAEIVTYMQGHGVMIVHPDHPDELIAYARLHPWEGLNDKGQQVFEFRSWIVSEGNLGKHYGNQVLRETVALGHALDPQAQIIAVVEADNTKAQAILASHGAVSIHKPSNVQVELGEGQAKVAFLDLSNI